MNLELEGFSEKLSLESSSSSSGNEETETPKPRKKKFQNYSKLIFVYEENCPFPNE